MRVTSIIFVLTILAVTVTGCGGQKVREAGKTSAATGIKSADKSTPLSSDDGEGAAGERIATAKKETASSSNVVSGLPAPTAKIEASKVIGGAAGDAKAEAPVTPPPSVADAITGTERRVKKPLEQPLPSGVLTAGSFDDNLDPRHFLSFLKKMSQKQGLQDTPSRMLGQRLLISVKDNSGKPVGGAKVQLLAKTGEVAELITRTDGRVVFLTSFDNLPADAALTATVTPPEGGASVTENIDAGAGRWEITLPAAQAKLPRSLDLAIVLDTTGSMGDELKYIQGEIRGISKAVHDRFPEVQQRFALVVYRDDGDEYVARHFDFTSLDVFHQNLLAQRAGGGGDYPEAVHRGFEEANQLRWSSAADTARIMFWIADAPPHAQHMNRTMAAANAIRKQGVTIYPIACSGYDDACEVVMRSCAMVTGGQFLFLTDDSGVGASHAEPKIPYYQVERLEKLMVRMIASELSGQRIDVNPADVIRTVGRKVN